MFSAPRENTHERKDLKRVLSVCPGEEFILIAARTFCSEDFPAGSAFEQIAERLALAEKDMIDVVLI